MWLVNMTWTLKQKGLIAVLKGYRSKNGQLCCSKPNVIFTPVQSWRHNICIIITSTLSEEYCGVGFLLLIWLFITNVHPPWKSSASAFLLPFSISYDCWFLAKSKSKSYQNVFRLSAVVEPVWLSLWFGIKPSQVTGSKGSAPHCSSSLPLLRHCLLPSFWSFRWGDFPATILFV